jgi:hypothetical protein
MQGHSRVQRSLIAVVLSLILLPPIWAKDWPLSIPKGGQVVLKIPTAFWQVSKNDVISLGGQRIYFVDMVDVLQKSDWETRGFPYCGEFILTKITEMRPFGKLRYTEVELRNNGIYVKLRFSADDHDLNAEFQKVATVGEWQQFEKSEEFRKNIFASQSSKIFTGSLANISDGLKLPLLHMVCSGQNTFKGETYKEKTYFSVTLGPSGVEYNSLKLNASARVSTVINERMLNMVKTFKDVAREAGIDGLKLTAHIDYRDFVSEVISHTDDLEIYLPLDLCAKFASADITSQQLIDGSIVILNGNRIQVSLFGTS